MPISIEEFKKAREKRLLTMPVLKFLYEHRDKAFSHKEIVEKDLIDEFRDFASLIIGGFIEFKQIDHVDYFAISDKGIEYLS